MKTPSIHAKLIRLRAEVLQQHEVDPEKVRHLIVHLEAGGHVPPVVVATYDGAALPLDGHHRLMAAGELGLEFDAWVVSGRAFDRLCNRVQDAESYVLCGGVPAMQVAGTWRAADGNSP